MGDDQGMALRLRGAADLLEREFVKARKRGQRVSEDDVRQAVELREAAQQIEEGGLGDE